MITLLQIFAASTSKRMLTIGHECETWWVAYFLVYYVLLAVSTRPPAGTNYRASRSNSLGPWGPL